MSTVEKALGLLEHLSVSAPEIGLSDFRKLTGLDKGTLYRYLTSLKNCGFLEQNPETKAYRLGPAVIRLAALREATVPLIKSAAPFVDRLAEETQELVHASLPQTDGMSTLYYRDGGIAGTRVGLDASEVLPFHATSSGIAFLSFASDGFRDAALKGKRRKYTPQTQTDTAQILEMMSATRANGYADASELYEAEVCSVALPFFGHGPVPLGTVAVATPASRMCSDTRAGFVHLLAEACLGLSSELGATPPDELAEIWRAL